MPSSTRQGQPEAPRWVYLPTSVDLKNDVLGRIEAYYKYDANVQATSEKWYKEWMEGDVKKMSATRVCNYAVNALKLNTVKFVQGSQLSKRTMVLVPFMEDMENTRTELNTGKTDSSKSSDDFTAIEAGSQTEEEESNLPGTQTTVNTLPSVIEGNSTMEGEMLMLPNNDGELNTIILNVVDRHLQAFRENFMKDIRDDMKTIIREAIQDDATMKSVVTMTRTELMETFTNDVRDLESNSVSNIQSELSNQMEKVTQHIHTKEHSIIKNFATKRDEILVDINDEAHQAIEDFRSAKEQKKSMMPEVHSIDPVDTDVKGPSRRFPNVDPTRLKVEHPEPTRYVESRPRQAQQQTWSLYGFHKHFKAKLKNDTQILNFYQQLYKQGSPYGVYCLPLHDIRPNVDLCPPQHRNQRNEIALTVYQKLQDEDCVSVGYYKAQRLIQQYASSSDGYKVLEQLLRSVHPNLQHSTAHTYEVPKLSNSYGNLYDYGSKIMNYVLMQNIKHRQYSAVEQTIMFLNNMDEKKYNEAKNRALAEIRHTNGTTNSEMDPNLMLESLPTTLEQYHEQIHGPSRHRPQGVVRSMYDRDEDNNVCLDVNEEEFPIIRAFGRKQFGNRQYSSSNRYESNNNNQNRLDRGSSHNKQCKACGRWGCSERKCQFVAKVQLAINFIKEHGNAASKLAEEYLRTNNRRTRMSTIRTLTANLSNENNVYPTDDELLNKYDIDIPMEEIDFEHNLE